MKDGGEKNKQRGNCERESAVAFQCLAKENFHLSQSVIKV